MKVKTSASLVLNQLKVLTKLVPPSSGNITLQVKKNNLYLYSMNDLATYESIVPCDSVEGDEVMFGVPLDAFKTLLSKRKEIEIAYVNTMCVVKEGSYHAELATTDAVENQDLTKDNEGEKPQTWKLTVEQSKWIKAAVSEVNLKVVETLLPFMPVTIKITEKGGFVVCYDSAHMCFIRSKDVSGDLYVTMPCDLLQSVFDAFSGNTFRMDVTESTLVLKSKLLKICLSLPLSDAYMDVQELLSVANSSVKEKGSLIKLNREEFLNFMDSCKAVATKERSELQAKASGKKLVLQVKTVSGNVKQTLPLSESVNPTEFKIDFTYLEEAVRKSDTDDLTLKVIGDSSLLVDTKNGSVVVSLNE